MQAIDRVQCRILLNMKRLIFQKISNLKKGVCWQFALQDSVHQQIRSPFSERGNPALRKVILPESAIVSRVLLSPQVARKRIARFPAIFLEN
jgi:hypothetical protein